MITPLTIRGVASNRDILIERLRGAGHVSLSLPDDAAMDLCTVQLIESARRFAEAEGGSLRLSRPVGGAVRDLLTSGGFMPSASAEDAAFWLHEGAGA